MVWLATPLTVKLPAALAGPTNVRVLPLTVAVTGMSGLPTAGTLSPLIHAANAVNVVALGTAPAVDL